MVKNCLRENPNDRPSLEDVGRLIYDIKKNSPQCTYCIRLHDDEGKKKQLNRKASV
jgi:hypothetical protein